MLYGEDRKRALDVLERSMTDKADLGGDVPCGGDTNRTLLAALEKEFVLVRPKPEKGSCEPCLLWGSCPLSENLSKSSVRDHDIPGPNCPARKEEG